MNKEHENEGMREGRGGMKESSSVPQGQEEVEEEEITEEKVIGGTPGEMKGGNTSQSEEHSMESKASNTLWSCIEEGGRGGGRGRGMGWVSVVYIRITITFIWPRT